MPTIRNSEGFTLIELAVIVVIMAFVFGLGTPKYINLIKETHNCNIEFMVCTIRSWSYLQAVDNLNNTGDYLYPLPTLATIENVVNKSNLPNWDDTDPTNWQYRAGGGISISGDGTFIAIQPIYIN